MWNISYFKSSSYKYAKLFVVGAMLINISCAEARLLRFSTVTNGEPFVSSGVSVLTRAYSCVGEYQIEAVQFPAKRALATANQGLTDGELIRPKLVGYYPNLRPVNVPILSYELIALSRLHSSLPGTEIRDFRGFNVGVIRGFQSTMHVSQTIDSVLLAHDGEHLVKLLHAGRLDYAIMMKKLAIEIITRFGLSEVNIFTPPLERKEFYHYLHKNNWHLIPQVENCLLQQHLDTFSIE